jgi:hypothetical protein
MQLQLKMQFLEQLNDLELPLEDCRCQCYDNAAVMSGRISGVQKRILDKNPLALFLNCDNHSLNLSAVHAAAEETLAVTFFSTVEGVYTFFAHSTVRWQQLKDVVKCTVKRESDTRWSSREEAVKVIMENIDQLVKLLEDMTNRQKHTTETCVNAQQLLDNILTYNFLCLRHFWNIVLGRINRVQKRLQDPTMNFREAAADLECLIVFFHEHHHDICEHAMSYGKCKCEEWGIEIERRVRRRRRMPGELARDAGLTTEQEVSRVLNSILDRLVSEMTDRFSRLRDLNTKFGFLLDTKSLLLQHEVPDDAGDKDGELRSQCLHFGETYSSDVNGNELLQEVFDCRLLIKQRQQKGSDFKQPTTPEELVKFIVSYGDDIFPNMKIALQMLLTVSVSTASCERSFSKMKLILTYLRASMSQSRLNDLALLSIEKETLHSIDFTSIIDDFAAMKARRVDI